MFHPLQFWVEHAHQKKAWQKMAHETKPGKCVHSRMKTSKN